MFLGRVARRTEVPFPEMGAVEEGPAGDLGGW